MITETTTSEEHIIHQYTKDWKSIKERFLKTMYYEIDINGRLEKKWNETYNININNDKPIKEVVPEATQWFESMPTKRGIK